MTIKNAMRKKAFSFEEKVSTSIFARLTDEVEKYLNKSNDLGDNPPVSFAMLNCPPLHKAG